MMMTEQELRDWIVTVAKSYQGTPYHHMGRIKGVGVDCATFLIESYEEAGIIEHIDLPYYPPDWHMHHTEELYLKELLKYGHRVKVPRPGDIALYRYGKTAAHGAIVINYPEIIHSVLNQGVIWADDQPLRGNLVGFYSYWEND
jgi:cell wall-associated NlpC family hydrolase